MKRTIAPPAFAALFVLLACSAPAVAQIPLPKLEARVTDLTGTLTAAQQSALEEKLEAFEDRKGAQIAVLILPTTAPEDIAQFGIRLAEASKVGREETDDGAILIVAKDDRIMRIEVGHGLEGALTDIASNRITDDTIAPLFKQGDFYGGINAGLDQMIRIVDGEELAPPDENWRTTGDARLPWPMLVIGAIVLGSMLRPLMGRFVGAGVAGLVGGGVVWLFTSRITLAAASAVGLFLVALMLGGFGGPRFGGRGSSRVFRDYGGFGGGGFGRGGGGGGWSGGGGSFGGGGASGRW